jgi:F-type H+-transporting ATPase subunit a
MEMPNISEFLPKPFLFEGTWFAFNRIDLIRVIIMTAMLLFLCITVARAHKRSLVGSHTPTKPQSIVEMGFDLVRNFTYDTLGDKMGKKAYPMIATIFFTILCFNLTGIIPGLNLAATAGIGVPIIFAIWAYFGYWREGIVSHGSGIVGFFKFVKSELFPPGLPLFVYPIYAVMELLQLVIIRPASLAIRLFANMMAGHILLALCFAATQFFVFMAAPLMKPLGALTLVGGISATCFELVIACLQAYIFSLLTCVYIQLSHKH